tara:strand:+ start:427 stop:750 length:324 start_codon:yes stop_codon:yes gene_type:complete
MSQFFPEGEGSHPLHHDEDGGYITNAQMQFYLNRQSSQDYIVNHSKFLKYLDACKKYNMISDCMESDESSAKMVWDHKKQAISFIFPSDGEVAENMLLLYDWEEKDD